MIKFFRNIRQSAIKENKIINYLKYAIGEIILVVIGILIAIQINNANEKRKLNQEMDQFKLSLISDLNKDLNSITNELNLLKNDTTKLADYFQRMSNIKVTVDTLIKIYHIEFKPRIYGAITFNDNTINSLKSTGKISNLDYWLQDELVQISEIKKNYYSVKDDINSYVDLVVLENHYYPRNDPILNSKSIINNSKLINKIWKKTKLEELGSFMISVFGLKYIIETEAIKQLQQIEIKTNEILVKLNSQ